MPRFGRRDDRLPEGFDADVYLALNPDVAEAVANGWVGSAEDHYRRHGRGEGRPFVRPVSRLDLITSGLDMSRHGLEIGPCHSPVASKRAGHDVEIVDYVDTATLRAHYELQRDSGLDIDAIEEVDHVWRGEPLADLVGRRGEHAWVIASHVLEHIPDPIRFLQGVADLLEPEGRLALAIPDKRYCFDHFVPLTFAGQWIDAYEQRRTGPTAGQAFEYFARCAQSDGRIAWAAGFDGEIGFLHSLAQADGAIPAVRDGADFAGEIHLWRFSPESFRLLIAELGTIGMIDLRIVDAAPTLGSEFFVTLGHGRDVIDEAERLDLLRAAVASDRVD